MAEITTTQNNKRIGLILLITGLVGWLASGWLVLERLALYADPNHVASCDMNPFISCTSVMKTAQASLLGFPNPLIGIAAFAVLITTAVVLLAGVRLPRWYWLGLQGGVTAGFALVMWFFSQSVFVIGALCPYCMIVWSMMIPLFILLTGYNIEHGHLFPKSRIGLTKTYLEWQWIVIVLIYLGIIASIFFRFISYWTR
jgi:uncharacterized membrane protein